ncbi:MAG: hypothetical protein KH354_03895 [Clostridiales bacterium]|nr:hypothetical protein [Clostridiales bacterium]
MTSNSFFEYLETSNSRERQAIAADLQALYNDAIRRRDESPREKYQEAVQRLHAIQDVFYALGIDSDEGTPFTGVIKEG